MNLPEGGHRIAGERRRGDATSFQVADSSSGKPLQGSFPEGGEAEVEAALAAAATAQRSYGWLKPEARATFLEALATGLAELGAELVERASSETALPAARIEMERGRTQGQLQRFAAALRGPAADGPLATLEADPERQPLPRPGLALHLRPLGPIAVFGASNFPLAFSVLGGDTSSALAAGCTVVVKAHPAHPGTSQLVADMIDRVVEAQGLPRGVFNMVHGTTHELGTALVLHPALAGVGFTGSAAGGQALLRAAAARECPIPVFAEMGSLNPVLLLPSAAACEATREAFLDGLLGSMTLGGGQFCTKPGVIFVPESERAACAAGLAKRLADAPAVALLHRGIGEAFRAGLKERERPDGEALGRNPEASGAAGTLATPAAWSLSAEAFSEAGAPWREEHFGPSTVLVGYSDPDQLESLTAALPGQLTATLHAGADDAEAFERLARVAMDRAGRVLRGGWPTGVEVDPAMHHGGPWPASSDPRFTAVGTRAIARWQRPVCLQNFNA